MRRRFISTSQQLENRALLSGSGIFLKSEQILSAGNAAEFADIDSDGDLDIVGTTIYFNDGSGQFRSSSTSPLPSANSIAVGDVDADGDLDLVFARMSDADSVWLNDGRGRFTKTAQNLGQPDDFSYQVVLGDVDGDGDLDAAFAKYDGPGEIWLNDGSGHFTNSGQELGGRRGSSYSIALGDLDGDSDLDVILGRVYEAELLYLNDGTGTFANSGLPVGSVDSERLIQSVALGDLDGDGDLDAVLNSRA